MQPKIFFVNLHKAYIQENHGFTLCAFDTNSNLIAGIVVLLDGDTAYYKFAASNQAALHLRPNNFLIAELISYLEKIGINKLNFGYTGATSKYNGLRKYKLAAGAREYSRFILKKKSHLLADISPIAEINRKVACLLNQSPSLDEIDAFSEEHYRSFV